jgi:hypothetical protein
MTDAPVPTQDELATKPVGELVSDMTSQVTTLLRKELDMAIVELRDEMRQAAKAGGMLSGGALSGYMSLLFGSFAAAWLLARKLPRPLAFGLVAAAYGAAAAVLLKRGQEEMKQVDPVPTQTVQTLKESVEWAKAQTA